MRLAFFASHNGSAMQAICKACISGKLFAEPVLTISNNASAAALTHARSFGMIAHHLSAKKLGSAEALDQTICKLLNDASVSHVILSGYMRKLGPATLSSYKDRILNVHPSLLPAFGGKGMYGDYVHEAVLASGVETSGATIHTVTQNYDEGPIINQLTCPVLPGDTLDTLKARVSHVETRLYIETLQKIASHEIELPT